MERGTGFGPRLTRKEELGGKQATLRREAQLITGSFVFIKMEREVSPSRQPTRNNSTNTGGTLLLQCVQARSWACQNKGEEDPVQLAEC